MQTKIVCQAIPSIQRMKMNIAFVLLLCAAAVSSFAAVDRAGSGAGVEDEDFGDLSEYDYDMYGSGLER